MKVQEVIVGWRSVGQFQSLFCRSIRVGTRLTGHFLYIKPYYQYLLAAVLRVYVGVYLPQSEYKLYICV